MTDFVIDHGPLNFAPADNFPEPTRDELSLRINTLEREVERLISNFANANQRANDYAQQIDAVRDFILDAAGRFNGIGDDLTAVAEMLDIELTKTISGTAIDKISWSATVPLDFDADDIEITFDVDCESYGVEDFDWNEDNCEVNGSDD